MDERSLALLIAEVTALRTSLLLNGATRSLKTRSNFVVDCPEETKQKIRAALLGRKQSYQHRERGRVARIGLKLSESRKAQLKISMLGPGNPMYGRHQSLKTRSLMSQNRTDKRRVIKRDMDGNITGEFPSVLQSAASVKNGSTSNISRCCKGKYDSCYKYRWEYA